MTANLIRLTKVSTNGNGAHNGHAPELVVPTTDFVRSPNNFLGVITAGSLVKGLQARIRTLRPLEEIQTGQFVVIEGKGVRFFGLLTDITLNSTSASILLDPPDDDTPALVKEVLHGVYTFGDAHIQPSLALNPAETDPQPRPVRSIPSHFSPVHIAESADFQLVFGQEDIGQHGSHFAIGRPLDMEIDVCMDLARFVERSNGVFGKSGTGKSVLTRLILAGLVRSGICANLIFDMHNEYGEGAQGEGGYMKGLRTLFGSRVLAYDVRDSRGERSRNATDGTIVIGLNQIDVEDILLLQGELNLNATAAESSYILEAHLGNDWIAKLLKMDTAEITALAEETGAHSGSVSALKRKLEQLKRLPFIEESAGFSTIDQIINNLKLGKHAVIEFGSSDNILSYMLIANIITRRIHKEWKEQTERFTRTKEEGDRPQRVMITIEEAHKFLTPAIASQTIFGTIAREMRKNMVTLLIVDQRPSSIDDEVMSQIGTRIIALINDERDIDAVFTGVSGAAALKTVLAGLDSRQQALALGHAMPMPVVIRTRPYDDSFYRAMSGLAPVESSDGKWSEINRSMIPRTNGGGNGTLHVVPAASDTIVEAGSFDEWEAEIAQEDERRLAEARAKAQKATEDLFG